MSTLADALFEGCRQVLQLPVRSLNLIEPELLEAAAETCQQDQQQTEHGDHRDLHHGFACHPSQGHVAYHKCDNIQTGKRQDRSGAQEGTGNDQARNNIDQDQQSRVRVRSLRQDRAIGSRTIKEGEQEDGCPDVLGPGQTVGDQGGYEGRTQAARKRLKDRESQGYKPCRSSNKLEKCDQKQKRGCQARHTLFFDARDRRRGSRQEILKTLPGRCHGAGPVRCFVHHSICLPGLSSRWVGSIFGGADGLISWKDTVEPSSV